MKTKNEKKGTLLKIRLILTFCSMILISGLAGAQDDDSVQTLFKPGAEFTHVWAPEIKLNSIQGKIGTLIGGYTGTLINRTVLFGFAGGVNLSHPEVNYGYIGVIGQYIYNPNKLVHLNGQLVLAYGSTKDYEQQKSGIFDNFWNISGTHYFMMEPGINLEINLRNNLALCTGMSYRYVTGMNENSISLLRTHVTNKEMGGMNFNIGFKIIKKNKNQAKKNNL
jgi:hypothetical protein